MEVEWVDLRATRGKHGQLLSSGYYGHSESSYSQSPNLVNRLLVDQAVGLLGLRGRTPILLQLLRGKQCLMAGHHAQGISLTMAGHHAQGISLTSAVSNLHILCLLLLLKNQQHNMMRRSSRHNAITSNSTTIYISVIHRDTICPAWAYSPTIAATAPVPSP